MLRLGVRENKNIENDILSSTVYTKENCLNQINHFDFEIKIRGIYNIIPILLLFINSTKRSERANIVI